MDQRGLRAYVIPIRNYIPFRKYARTLRAFLVIFVKQKNRAFPSRGLNPLFVSKFYLVSSRETMCTIVHFSPTDSVLKLIQHVSFYNCIDRIIL